MAGFLLEQKNHLLFREHGIDALGEDGPLGSTK